MVFDFSSYVVPHPLKVQIHPTNRCNLNCNFCWLHHRHHHTLELSDRRWLEIADELVALDPRLIAISGGGEPLVRRTLILKMMRLFSSKGIPGQLITNGTLIDKKAAEILVSSCWEDIIVSIQATGSLDGRIRGKRRAFKLSSRGIAHINSMKKRYSSSLPNLTVMSVLTRDNCLSLPALAEFCISAGINSLTARLVNTEETGNPAIIEILPEQHTQFWESIQHAKEIAQDKGLILSLEFEENQFRPIQKNTEDLKEESEGQKEPEEHSRVPLKGGSCLDATRSVEPLCPLPFYEMVIFASGKVGGCCSFFTPKSWVEGFVSDAGNTPLKTIWEEGLSSLRHSLLEGNPCSLCKACTEDLRFHMGRWPEWYWKNEFNYLRCRKRYGEALAIGKKDLRNYPDNPVLHYLIGSVLMDMQDFEEAIPHLKSAVHLNPHDTESKMKLAESHFKTHRFREVEQSLREVLEMTEDPLQRMHCWFFLASIGYKTKGKALLAEAMDALARYTDLLSNINDEEREFIQNLRRKNKLPEWLQREYAFS